MFSIPIHGYQGLDVTYIAYIRRVELVGVLMEIYFYIRFLMGKWGDFYICMYTCLFDAS